MNARERAQFWVAIIATIGSIVITGSLIVAVIFMSIYDVPVETVKEAMLVAVGGVISLPALAASWLFARNGNGNGSR